MNGPFFTSDIHFGHVGIIHHCHRPFESVEQMNETLLANYNAVVGKKDDVYILGDVAFVDPTPWVERMNGRKHLIMGNHDQPKKAKLHACPFQWIKDVAEISIMGQKIWLSHYPHRAWPGSHHGHWHLYGHSHGSMPPAGKSLDVGVDCWDLAPVGFETISQRMTLQPDIDHHATYQE